MAAPSSHRKVDLVDRGEAAGEKGKQEEKKEAHFDSWKEQWNEGGPGGRRESRPDLIEEKRKIGKEAYAPPSEARGIERAGARHLRGENTPWIEEVNKGKNYCRRKKKVQPERPRKKTTVRRFLEKEEELAEYQMPGRAFHQKQAPAEKVLGVLNYDGHLQGGLARRKKDLVLGKDSIHHCIGNKV